MTGLPRQPDVETNAHIAALARTHSLALRRFFERRVLEHADIDDLVQEVFLRLARRGDLSDIAYLEGYLFETAANILRDRLRKRITHRTDAHGALDDEQPSDAAFSPERVLIGKEAVDRLTTALKELPERTRTVFMLKEFEELKAPAVAERLGVSISTVEKDMAKAVGHLLARMKDHL